MPIALFPIIFYAMLGTAAVAVVALADRKWKSAVAWAAACIILTACGMLVLRSWNAVMLRVNQITPSTQAVR